MVDNEDRMAKYLYHGYEYSIVSNFKKAGVETKEDAIKHLKKLILINIRSFKLNQLRGENNKINESINKVLWYFKDDDFKRRASHL